MIDWGPASAGDRIGQSLRNLRFPLLYSLGVATFGTPVLLWIKEGWPPAVPLDSWAFAWCLLFGVFAMLFGWSLTQMRRWLELFVLAGVAIVLILLVSWFAIPFVIWTELVPVVVPVAAVNP